MGECWFSYPDSYPVVARVIISTIFAIYCPLIITVNAVLIASFIATKQSIRHTSNLLIVCLSSSDCLLGFLMPLMPIESVASGSEWFCTLNRVSTTLQSFVCGTSLGMTMLLATDRYFHMNPNFQRNPPKIAKLFKWPRIFILIIACVVFSSIVSLSLLLAFEFNPMIAFYIIGFYAALVLIMMMIFVTIYVRSYLRIRHFAANNPVYQNRDANESPEYVKALFKTVLLLVTATVASWLPFISLNIAATVSGFVKYNQINDTAYIIFARAAYTVFLSNAFINALIILSRNKKSRKWLKKRFCSCCKRREDEDQATNSVVIANIGVEEPGVNSNAETKL